MIEKKEIKELINSFNAYVDWSTNGEEEAVDKIYTWYKNKLLVKEKQ